MRTASRPAWAVVWPFSVNSGTAGNLGPSVGLCGVLGSIVLAKHDLAVSVERKGFQHNVEAFPVLVRRRHANIEPVVVLFWSLNDRVDLVHLRHFRYPL